MPYDTFESRSHGISLCLASLSVRDLPRKSTLAYFTSTSHASRLSSWLPQKTHVLHTQCRRSRKEITKLRTFEEEPCFGLQIATNNIAEGVNAAQMAHAAGAAFIDLNCGCPIYGMLRAHTSPDAEISCLLVL